MVTADKLGDSILILRVIYTRILLDVLTFTPLQCYQLEKLSLCGFVKTILI